MKSMLLVGVALIILGGASLAYRGFTVTKQETVLDIGPIQATRETKERIPIPALLGWALLMGGVLAVGGSFMQANKA